MEPLIALTNVACSQDYTIPTRLAEAALLDVLTALVPHSALIAHTIFQDLMVSRTDSIVALNLELQED